MRDAQLVFGDLEKASIPHWQPAYTYNRRGRLVTVPQRGIAPAKGVGPFESEHESAQRAWEKRAKRRGPGKGQQVVLTSKELEHGLTRGRFALISAGRNPNHPDDMKLTDEQVEDRARELRRELVQLGYTFTKVEGRYGAKETSYLVMIHDANREHVVDLGKRLNQDSIIYGDGGRYEVKFTTGKNADDGLCLYSHTWRKTTGAKQDYTLYKHRDHTQTQFTIDFDWDNKVPCACKGLACSLQKAITHESFVPTVLTSEGKVSKIGIGRFGARKIMFRDGVQGVLKPRLHSNEPFRGIPRNEFHLREVAAYQLDWQLLRFGVVPPTLLTVFEGEPASVQAWVDGKMAAEIVPGVFKRDDEDWKERLALFAAKINVDQLRRVCLFDLIVNNTDRHAKNCLFDTHAQQVWAIDNGCCFGPYFQKYRNVFHKWIFRNKLVLTIEEARRLKAVTRQDLDRILSRYLRPSQIEQTFLRIRWVLDQPSLGFDELAQGEEKMPAFRDWFRAQAVQGERNLVMRLIQRMGTTA